MQDQFYIRTQRQNTYVGGENAPEVFATRSEARARADELKDSTPSSYGRLIVSRVPDELACEPVDTGPAIERAALSMLDADADECPVCGMEHVAEGKHVDTGRGRAYQPMTCTECDATWTEGYVRVNVHDVADAQGVPLVSLVTIENRPPSIELVAVTLDEYAQGDGEGDPRVQLAAALLTDALGPDDALVPVQTVEVLLAVWVGMMEQAR